MKDFTNELKAYGEARKTEEVKLRESTLERIERCKDYIYANSKDLDILIANANAAVGVGIRIDSHLDSHYDFENNNFYANGIRHRLGFIKDDYRENIIGLGVIGGGCNGDVSVVYKHGEVIYDTDKYVGHHKGFQALHPLETMNQRLLSHYAYAFRTFANDIEKFCERFEQYLENEISGKVGGKL